MKRMISSDMSLNTTNPDVNRLNEWFNNKFYAQLDTS